MHASGSVAASERVSLTAVCQRGAAVQVVISLNYLIFAHGREACLGIDVNAAHGIHQLAQAWNAYLVDERKFPSELGSGKKQRSEYDNIKWLAGYRASGDESGRIYLELNDKEKKGKAQGGGLRDHWGQLFGFTLDMDYDGLVENPYPDVFVDEGDSPTKYEKIRASSIVWSEGNPKYEKRKDNPIVVW